MNIRNQTIRTSRLSVPTEASLLGRLYLLCGRLGSTMAISLIDQLVVSGARFATIILIGRAAGAEQLGAYALAIQILLLIAVAQESLVSAPYTIHCNRQQASERSEYAGSVLAHAALQMLGVVALLAVASLISTSLVQNASFSTVAWIVTAITPLVLLREFGRRFAFADMRMGVAIAIDVAMAAIQLTGLAILIVTDSLSIAGALWITGIAAGLPGICWLIYDRRRFAFKPEKLLRFWKQSWQAGRWLFGSQFIVAATNVSLYSILAVTGGLAVTGVFAACMAIVQLANPVLLGLSNWLEPLTAKACAGGGIRKLRDIVRNAQLALTVSAAAFCVAVFLFGAQLIAFIYGSAEFMEQRHVVFILALSVLADASGLPPQFGLRAIDRARLVFASNVLESFIILSVVAALGFLARADLLAAAYALVAGPAVATMVQTAIFFKETTQAEPVAGSSTALAGTVTDG